MPQQQQEDGEKMDDGSSVVGRYSCALYVMGKMARKWTMAAVS
jgi:hypothetical protein